GSGRITITMPEQQIGSGPRILADAAPEHDLLRTQYRAKNLGTVAPFEQRLLENAPKVEVAKVVDYLLERLQFQPQNEHWTTERDPLHELGTDEDDEEGFFRRGSSYIAKAIRERLKGRSEAASYG